MTRVSWLTLSCPHPYPYAASPPAVHSNVVHGNVWRPEARTQVPRPVYKLSLLHTGIGEDEERTYMQPKEFNYNFCN